MQQSSRKFLVVEDNDGTMLLFSMLLQKITGSQVLQARTADDALCQVQSFKPTFMIVSWELRAGPGTFLIQRLKSLTKRRHVPYMLYSQKLGINDLALLKEMGFENILTLPMPKDKLFQEIDSMVRREESISYEERTLRQIEAAIEAQRPQDALKLFDERLRQKGPYFVRAQVLYSEIMMLNNQLGQAEQALKAALEVDPTAYTARTGLANLYSRMEKHDDALKILTELSAKSPKNLNTMVNLGATYVHANRLTEAKQTFAKISYIDPDTPGLKDEEAKMAFKEGDIGKAAALLANTEEGDKMARYFNNLAISYARKSLFDQAVETYQNAIKVLVNRAKLYALRYNLGLAYVRKGDFSKGFAELFQSYKEDPTFEKAYVALVKCTKEMQAKGITPDPTMIREVKTLRAKTHPASTKAAS